MARGEFGIEDTLFEVFYPLELLHVYDGNTTKGLHVSELCLVSWFKTYRGYPYKNILFCPKFC